LRKLNSAPNTEFEEVVMGWSAAFTPGQQGRRR
jgi:hypothetical protein